MKRTSATEQRTARARLAKDQGRANCTVTPTASPFQLRSVVSTDSVTLGLLAPLGDQLVGQRPGGRDMRPHQLLRAPELLLARKDTDHTVVQADQLIELAHG